MLYGFFYYCWGQHGCWTVESIIGNDFFVFHNFPLPSILLLPPPALPTFRCPWVGFSNLKNGRIRFQKFWNRSGVGVWKSNSEYLCHTATVWNAVDSVVFRKSVGLQPVACLILFEFCTLTVTSERISDISLFSYVMKDVVNATEFVWLLSISSPFSWILMIKRSYSVAYRLNI